MSAGRRVGLLGGVAGVVAVGAAAGIAVERYAVGRARLRPDPEAAEPFGELPGRWRMVPADDGLPLAVLEGGRARAQLTVVFVHGFTVDSRCWHYQWRALCADGVPAARLVCYDQRSHGRSGRSSREHATIDQLGRDLHAVLQAAAPGGPIVLIGHSLGGMSVMALAESHPELFGPRVKAVALLSTAPGRLGELTFGLPAVVGTVARRVIPHAVPVLGKRAALVDHGRRVGGDIAFLATRQLAFGSNVSPSVVEFMEQMVAGTPFDVIADFYADFKNHDKLAALTTLDGLPTLVLCGERDKITPADHSRSIVDSLPGAELVIVPATGHMVMLERPAVLTAHLRVLMSRATRAADAQPA